MVHLGLKFKNSQFPVQSTNPHLLTVPSCFVFHFHGCMSELCAKESLHRTRGLICFPGEVLLRLLGWTDHLVPQTFADARGLERPVTTERALIHVLF